MRVVNIGGACLLVAVLGSACGAPGEGVPAAGKQRAGLTTPMKLHAAQASVADAWTRIDLPQSYTSMVVVATAEYAASSAPVTARIRNATGSSFELRVQRVDGGTAALPELPVSYLVAEAGIYSASSGLKMEAVTFDSTVTDRKGSFSGQRRSYRQAYVSPVVLGQVQTANDAWPSLFWSRGSSRSVPPDSVLRVGKHVGEDTRSRADETLGYVIVEAGSGALSGASWQAGVTPWQAGVTPLSVRGVAGDAPFAQSLASPGPASFAVASQTGMNNADGSFALLAGPAAATGSSLRLGVDEDNWGDGERNHGAERVAFFALNPCPSPEARAVPTRTRTARVTTSTCAPAFRTARTTTATAKPTAATAMSLIAGPAWFGPAS
jgi:hypothetical protein